MQLVKLYFPTESLMEQALKSSYVSNNITITSVNDTPVVTVLKEVNVLEEEFVLLNESYIDVLDPDNTDSELTYTLLVPPQSGILLVNGEELTQDTQLTQEMLEEALITYQHDGSESSSDTIEFQVSDGNTTSDRAILNINVEPVDDTPLLFVERLSVSAGQTSVISDALAASDQDTTPENLVYILVDAPEYGSLLIGDRNLAEEDTFTHADVVAGKLLYANNVDAGIDSFQVTLQDASTVLDPEVVFLDISNEDSPVITGVNFIEVYENESLSEIPLIVQKPVQGLLFGFQGTIILTGDDADLFTHEFRGEGFGSSEIAILAKNDVSFDFENPLDKNRDNLYEVIVLATDSNGVSSEHTLQIGVLNILEVSNVIDESEPELGGDDLDIQIMSDIYISRDSYFLEGYSNQYSIYFIDPVEEWDNIVFNNVEDGVTINGVSADQYDTIQISSSSFDGIRSEESYDLDVFIPYAAVGDDFLTVDAAIYKNSSDELTSILAYLFIEEIEVIREPQQDKKVDQDLGEYLLRYQHSNDSMKIASDKLSETGAHRIVNNTTIQQNEHTLVEPVHYSIAVGALQESFIEYDVEQNQGNQEDNIEVKVNFKF